MSPRVAVVTGAASGIGEGAPAVSPPTGTRSRCSTSTATGSAEVTADLTAQGFTVVAHQPTWRTGTR